MKEHNIINKRNQQKLDLIRKLENKTKSTVIK